MWYCVQLIYTRLVYSFSIGRAWGKLSYTFLVHSDRKTKPIWYSSDGCIVLVQKIKLWACWANQAMIWMSILCKSQENLGRKLICVLYWILLSQIKSRICIIYYFCVIRLKFTRKQIHTDLWPRPHSVILRCIFVLFMCPCFVCTTVCLSCFTCVHSLWLLIFRWSLVFQNADLVLLSVSYYV